MLEGEASLTLDQLNLATQAWITQEYHGTVHSELGEIPLQRFLAGPNVGRECPGSEATRWHSSGVLLVGPPDAGKTLLARTVAGEAEVPFFTISCLMTKELRHLLCDHAAGNYRILIGRAADLIMAAAQTESTVLDEKLYFQVFNLAVSQAQRRAGGAR